MKDENLNLVKLIRSIFSLSKFICGFWVQNSEYTRYFWYLDHSIFSFFLIANVLCTARAMSWNCVLWDIVFNLKTLILFVLLGVIGLSPFFMFVVYRRCAAKLVKLVTLIEEFEKEVHSYEIHIQFVRVRICGTLYFLTHLSVAALTNMFYVCAYFTPCLMVDYICIGWYDIWVICPIAQFICLMCFLNYVLSAIQNDVFKSEQSLRCGIPSLLKLDVSRTIPYKRRKIKCFMKITKMVLNIAKELSTAYEVVICIFLLQYVSRVITLFYDLIDQDAQRFSGWSNVWSMTLRVVSVIPVFFCCEHLKNNGNGYFSMINKSVTVAAVVFAVTYFFRSKAEIQYLFLILKTSLGFIFLIVIFVQVNQTAQLLQEMVSIHRPSCLDNIYQSFTLRMQHQSATIQLCGVLDISYNSLLRMVGTAITFLVFQLQFLS